MTASNDYWGPRIDWLKSTMRETGCIADEDLSRFVTLNDASAIADLLDRSIDGHEAKPLVSDR